jgi:hypothetical protein
MGGLHFTNHWKVKIKFTLEKATKAQRGSRGIPLLFLLPWRYMGVGSQCHAPAALPPGKTRYPLYRWLGGPQGQSGQVWKISTPTGIQSADHPTCSELLYRLSFPGPCTFGNSKGLEDEPLRGRLILKECKFPEDVLRQFYHLWEAIYHRSPHLWDLQSGCCFIKVMHRTTWPRVVPTSHGNYCFSPTVKPFSKDYRFQLTAMEEHIKYLHVCRCKSSGMFYGQAVLGCFALKTKALCSFQTVTIY